MSSYAFTPPTLLQPLSASEPASSIVTSLPSAKKGYTQVSSRTLCIVLPDPLGIHLTLMVVSD